MAFLVVLLPSSAWRSKKFGNSKPNNKKNEFSPIQMISQLLSISRVSKSGSRVEKSDFPRPKQLIVRFLVYDFLTGREKVPDHCANQIEPDRNLEDIIPRTVL